MNRRRLIRALVAAAVVVRRSGGRRRRARRRPTDHAAQAWNVLPPGQAGGVAFTKNSTDQIALYEGLTRLRDNVTDADLAPVLQARDARARAGRQGGEGRASAQGCHDHPRPVGRAARQGDDRRERRLRRRLGDRRRSPADHGAAPRPGPHRRARRAGRERVRASRCPGGSSGRARRPRRGSASSSRCCARRVRRGRQAIRIIDAYVAGINAEYRQAGLRDRAVDARTTSSRSAV